MKTGLMVAITTIALLGLGTAGAHDKGYVAAGGVVATAYCGTGEFAPGINGIGGVCYDSGHVTANLLGVASISMTDFNNPASATVCQDGNANMICGETGELSEPFCSSTVIGNGDGWSSGGGRVWVFPHGATQGAATQTWPCGGPAPGTTGVVGHLP